MKHRRNRLVATTAAVALVAGAGAASATSSHSAKSGGPGVILRSATTYLGLTKRELADRVRSGETLAQIATAQGKSVSGLELAIEAAIHGRLDRAVTAGKITSEREARILSRLPARLDKLVNSSHPGALIRHSLSRKRR